jgi:hypothetical protein
VIEDEDIIEAYESFLGEVIDVEWPSSDTSYNFYVQLKNLVTQHSNFGRYHSYSGFTQLIFNSVISMSGASRNDMIRELLLMNTHLSDPLLEQLTKDFVAEQLSLRS